MFIHFHLYARTHAHRRGVLRWKVEKDQKQFSDKQLW